MDADHHLETVHAYFERIWNASDQSFIGDVISPDYYAADPDLRAELQGYDGVKDNVAFYRLAFPDLEIEIEDAFGTDDRVAVRWSGHGTHAGRILGIDPTGNHVHIRGTSIFSFDADGRILQEWTLVDLYHLLEQIGALVEAEWRAVEDPMGQPATEFPHRLD
jgi:steroid delta-isomerase-like uncharacterized protein